MEPVEVLFLAHRAPYPPDKGDRLRAWRHLGRLARLGPVDLVAQADDARAAARARQGLSGVCREVHVFPRRRALALARVGAACLARGSLTEAWHRDGRVAGALASLARRHAYGLCWGFSSGTGPWWRSVPARRRVFDLCDLDALKWRALAEDGGWIGAVRSLEAARLLPREVALAEAADLTLLSTVAEAADLAARARPRRLEVLTNGVPLVDFAGLPPPSTAGPVFGFLGQMDYAPNVAAAVHLAREVLPRVRARVPDARLAILGRAPTRAVAALAAPGAVEVAGEIDSVPAALGGLAAFIAPLDRGRGIPNKILEALAAGRPTVVSGFSARALEGRVGRDYLVADGAGPRADAVAGLLADPARRDALGAAGRAYVERHHDWEAVLDRLERLVREVLDA